MHGVNVPKRFNIFPPVHYIHLVEGERVPANTANYKTLRFPNKLPQHYG